MDNLVYQTEKALKESKDVSNDLKVKVEGALQEAKKVLDNKSASLDELKSAMATLQSKSHEFTSSLYQKQAAGEQQPSGGAGNSDGKSKDDVIDVDYKDVN